MAAFVYRNGDDVPPDATRVVVHPSVRVLPPKAFRGRDKLEEVRLHADLEEIGDEAFSGCVSLRRLDGPSAVVRIGAWAFRGCAGLEEVRLNEGLEAIGDEAFFGCVALRRLLGDGPSTVVRIGNRAFALCEKLEEIRLPEGLKEIGNEAFYSCVSLRRLDCPSTVVRIGDCAFYRCSKLAAVDLAGIIKVERGAFAGHNSLRHIGILSRAFIVKERFHSNYTCRVVIDGTMNNTRDAFELIAPSCLTALPDSNLRNLGNSINTIMNNGEGTGKDRLGRVFQEVRKEVRGEVSAILGLAFWKAKINEAERAGIGAANNHHKDTGGGRKRAENNAVLTWEAREGCRGAGKGKLIAENVLPFLDGLWGNGLQGGL